MWGIRGRGFYWWWWLFEVAVALVVAFGRRFGRRFGCRRRFDNDDYEL